MDGGKGKDQESRSIRNSSELIPQGLEVLFSQCVKCTHNRGKNLCGEYDVKPKRYQMRSAGVKCPRRSV